MALASAVLARDTRAALDASVSYEEVVSVTRKDVDRTEYEDELRSFIANVCREFREARGARIVAAKTTRTDKH